MNVPVIRFDRLGHVSPRRQAVVPIVAIVVALAVGAGIVAVAGYSPSAAYRVMFEASLGSSRGFRAMMTRAGPLILTGLAVSLALRVNLWNIGGEGQLLIGAISAAAVGFALPDLPGWLLMTLMITAAAVGGALWAQIAAVPRATIGMNEIIVTLFLNYIAIRIVSALVLGPWRDPGAVGFAYSRAIPTQSRMGSLPVLNLSAGILVALTAVGVAAWLFNRTRWGFGVDVIGGNPHVSRYLGLKAWRFQLWAMAASGAAAGLAGFIQLTAATQRVQPDLAAGYGFSGILLAFLAGRSVVALLAVGVFFATLVQGGFAMQHVGIPSALSLVIQAVIILMVLIGSAASRYRISFGASASSAASQDAEGRSAGRVPS